VNSNKKKDSFVYYDTAFRSSFFGDTGMLLGIILLVKDKQHLDFNELLEDSINNKSHSRFNSVLKNKVPNTLVSQSGVTQRSVSIRTNKILPEKIKAGQQSNIHVFRKSHFDQKRCQSVLESRRNWNTSAHKKGDDDSPLDLNKQVFGHEYRKVLDKLVEPKLPDNREMRFDPAYEYAQKANKLRYIKKVDLLKNKEFLKYLQRQTRTTYIRNML